MVPTEPKEEELKFGSANTWNKEQLDLLEVHFNPNVKRGLDLDKLLNVNESDWPLELQERIYLHVCFIN